MWKRKLTISGRLELTSYHPAHEVLHCKWRTEVIQVGRGLLLTATSPVSALGAFAWQSTVINHQWLVFLNLALCEGRANRWLWKALKTCPYSVSLTEASNFHIFILSLNSFPWKVSNSSSSNQPKLMCVSSLSTLNQIGEQLHKSFQQQVAVSA